MWSNRASAWLVVVPLLHIFFIYLIQTAFVTAFSVLHWNDQANHLYLFSEIVKVIKIPKYDIKVYKHSLLRWNGKKRLRERKKCITLIGYFCPSDACFCHKVKKILTTKAQWKFMRIVENSSVHSIFAVSRLFCSSKQPNERYQQQEQWHHVCCRLIFVISPSLKVNQRERERQGWERISETYLIGAVVCHSTL